ncbi:LysR family transcriptional regulator [Klebsiella quasipneumoniae subsp. similipneumoniae]|nr:LysR family transcriptional regulator [Klebsiella quasipneumoniae subsp. similipneumoniae]PII48645.1 LysR family transcriptional regulator [Klebsiella quasipneumoniae]OVW20170.1 LysR family transcriptional regulator [Klebsiella quasipneumoniae subsp. similipneumoniae]OVW31222.1 LysR family transcriptional regulator [Klebsiella quasipneumoniae subsp. similipneumoniae]OVW32523.1 LysR family transcriptional regulator [Klebsiella quasipneumoniae subsp. similipneumoniae]
MFQDRPFTYCRPGLLKLTVLTASKSLRRSRKAGAARMDAG